MGDREEKEYLSIREAAELMGYTRQYVYRALSNRFKDYLKIIDGEKKLHVDVLKLCNHVNMGDKQNNNKFVTLVTDNNNSFNDVEQRNIAGSNHVNTVGEQLGDRLVNEVTGNVYNKNHKGSILADCNQVNIKGDNGYNRDKLFYETIAVLKQQLLMKDKQLEEKDKQLDVKDKQIDTLQNELNLQNEHARKQSDRLVGLIEQVNELQRNNQVLLAQKDINSAKEIESKKESKGIFKRWFKKNDD